MTEDNRAEQEPILVDAEPRRHVCGRLWRGPAGIAPWGWEGTAVGQAFKSLGVTESGRRTKIVFSFSGPGYPFGAIEFVEEGRANVSLMGLTNFPVFVDAGRTTKPQGLITAIRAGESRLEESTGHAPPWASIEFDIDSERCSSIEVEFSPPGVSPKQLTIVLEEHPAP